MATAAPASIFDLADLKKLYREARDNTAEARKDAELCFDYYDNKQWTSEQIKVLRKRKQPEIWINRIAPNVDGILGVIEQGQSNPRAFPRNNADENAAEIATDSLRYAADRSRWQRTKLKAAKNYFIGGVAAVIVEVNTEGDPHPRLIRYNEFIYDPHSQDDDFEDARHMGIAKWMYVDVVKAMYPKADIDPAAISPTSVSFDDADKPENAWGDAKRNRVLVVEMFINKGTAWSPKWYQVCFYGGGILREGLSPYVDEHGRPINPVVAQSHKIDRNNARYGSVKAMIPLQDEKNMRRSKGLHLLNSRQVRITDLAGPQQDANVIRAEAALPDGVLPFGVEPVQTGDQLRGQIEFEQSTTYELERMGPNPANLGRSAPNSSGRSKLVEQQAGLTEMTPALGGIEDMDLRVYQQMWLRIRQYWTAPKLIRVTDDIGAMKFLTVNEPVVQEVPAIVQGPDGRPMAGTQQIVVEVKNRPAEMEMDIIIDSTPDTVNLQAEQFDTLAQLATVYGPQEVPFDDLLEASNLPRKRQLIEKREARKQEAAQGQQPAQQMQQAAFAAELEGKQAKAMFDMAKAEGQQIQNQLAPIEAGARMGAAAGP